MTFEPMMGIDHIANLEFLLIQGPLRVRLQWCEEFFEAGKRFRLRAILSEVLEQAIEIRDHAF